jgi:peroxiredoxin Q/BCP
MTNLKKGDKAPNFSCNDENGNIISLADFKGKKLVLYFYPKDLTPGCTMESCNLRDNYDLMLKQGYDVLGVSADDEKKHLRFILADVDKKVIKDYGVWGPKKFMGREFDGIHRTTFVIDENGIIEDVIIKVKTKAHAEQIMESAD